MKPTLSYLICTTPRSGSWMLCSILRQTGMAGRLEEFFGPTLNEEFNANRNVTRVSDVRDYLDRAIETSTGTNGVFGTKLLASMTPVFLRRSAEHKGVPFASLREALESEFPNLHYVWLTRENKVAQAISFYRALQTQIWINRAGAPPAPPRPVTYDRFAIQRCYQEVEVSDAYWQGFFSTHGISPLHIVYEELLAGREPVTQHLLRYLSLPSDIPIPAPKTVKLANDESLAWEEEFRRTGSIPPPAVQPPHIWAPF